MYIPEGMTESEVLGAIERVVAVLAPSFVFGYYTREDIEQEARRYALELLEKGKYDAARPLANYVYRHVKNRLINLKRKQMRRAEPACRACHEGKDCERARAEGELRCGAYTRWEKRNEAKANLLRPLDLEGVSDEGQSVESTVEEEASLAEVLRNIDLHLPVELRPAYLRMRAGVSVPRAQRREVEEAVRRILGDGGCPDEDD